VNKKYILVCLIFCNFVFCNFFYKSSSLIFSKDLLQNWRFEFERDKYGVSVAGYLSEYTWKNSPIIIYGEIIATNYQFDLYTKIKKMQKTNQIAEARYKEFSINLNSVAAYDSNYWFVEGLVYEYITYFSLNESTIASLVISSRDNQLLNSYLDDYKNILINFSKVAGTLKN
jgi:hypothetical protein